MSSERSLLVTVVMMRGMVVVVGSTYLIHCSDDTTLCYYKVTWQCYSHCALLMAGLQCLQVGAELETETQTVLTASVCY